MSEKVAVREVDGMLAVTLPKEVAERMLLHDGDELYAVETGRGLLLATENPTLTRAMDLYQRGARKYRDALGKLAE